jgi:hypothetical protein
MQIVGTVFMIFLALIILPFLILVLTLVSKSKKSAWQGEVLEKVHNTKDDDGKTEHFYSLKVKMLDGQTRNIGLSGQMWDGYKVGDKIKKDSGELYPKKV